MNGNDWNHRKWKENKKRKKNGPHSCHSSVCVWAAHPLNCDKLKINLLQHSVKNNQSTRRTPCTNTKKKKRDRKRRNEILYKINNRKFKRKTVNKCQYSKSLDICILCIQKYSIIFFFPFFFRSPHFDRKFQRFAVGNFVSYCLQWLCLLRFLQSVFVKDSCFYWMFFFSCVPFGLFDLFLVVAINSFFFVVVFFSFSVLSSFMSEPT